MMLRRAMYLSDDEKAYLASYDKRKFDAPIITVDSVLLTYHEGALKVLLVQRCYHPDKGSWGLPGGFIDLKNDANLEDTALRKLREKTGVAPPYLEQLCTLGNAKRDKRCWSVTVCYTALIAHQRCEANVSIVADVKWIALEQLDRMTLAFDHRDIIGLSLERLRQKALYSIVPAYALPEKFTLPELQHLHETLLGKPIQKKSFRRRIEQAGLLIDTGEKRSEGGGRPATLYRMKENSGAFTFVRNLEE
jgi:8-oxo-dGTP diphosphatase